MIEHREPADAVHRIRVMHDALYNFKHDLLGADAPGVPVKAFRKLMYLILSEKSKSPPKS